MNPSLIHAVRQRMRERSHDELLALWVTNDRAMYSPEAFEAVRSLLAERGLREVPPQNDPAPLAGRHSRTAEPTVQYWLGWLRPVLWVCVCVSAAGVPWALFLVGSLAITAFQNQVPVYDLWRGVSDAALWIDQYLSHIVMPVWLLVAALAGLRLKSWARPLLLWYAATAVAVAAILAVLRLAEPSLRLNGPWVVSLPMTIAHLAQSLVLPAVLWTLLRRPEIAGLFATAPSGHAFEPLAAAPAASDPTVS